MKRLLWVLLVGRSVCYGQVYSNVYTFAGSASAGHVDGTLSDSRFNWPYGICYDAVSHAIYVADAYNHVIRKIQDGLVSTVAGNGTPGYADGQGDNAMFNTPTGVYFRNGVLYICDNLNNRIRQMDELGNVSTVAGSGTWGFADGPATSAAFKEPKSLVADNDGVVYVADYENHRIRKVQNGMVSTIAGSGEAGDGTGPALSAALNRPRDLCIAPDGTIYFVDLMNHRLKRLTTAGNVEILAGDGTPGWADGIGESAEFDAPVGIDWLSANELLVMDAVNPRFRKVTTTGVVTTLAGSGMTGYQDGPAPLSSFDLPQDVCRGANGDLYIADRNNNCIRILYKSGNEPQFVEEMTASTPLAAYPNPANDAVQIDISFLKEPIAGLIILDDMGRNVMSVSQVVGAQDHRLTLTLPITNLAYGRYTVLLRTSAMLFHIVFVKE